VNGTLFFTAYTLSGGYQVWQSNGTSAGTVADTSLNTGGSAVPSALTAASSSLYFTAPGATLYDWQIVTQTTPTVTWSSPTGIVYGTPLSSSQLDATASVAGTFSYSPPLGTVLGAGTDTLSVTFTPTDTTDYTTATATTTIAVAQATPTLSWTSPAGIVYGTALTSAQLDATASIPGTFTYSPALGTVLGAGTDTLSVSFTPTDSTDYKGTAATTTIAVAQATPTVTWASPATIYNGTALSTAQLDATASVPGTFTYSPAAGTVLGVGNNQTLSVSFAPTDSTDYTSASATTTINVLPAPTASATLLNQDTKTQGTWIGTYGAQGYDVIDGSSSLPSYATVTPSGQSNYVWASSTTDARALQTSGGSSRIAATWFSKTSFTVDVNLTDGKVHDLELYFLDWDNWGRAEQVQISNASTGAVLSTQSISSFQSGLYLDYAVSGNILITLTNLQTKNAVLSGLFIDPVSAPTITWPSPAGTVYGTALSSAQLDATASVPGTFTYSPPLGTVLGAGTDTLSVTFTPTDTTDYTTATATTTIVVAQATPGVVWTNPASIVYGTALSSAQLDATASVPGTFTYSPALGTVLGAGTDTLSVSFTPTDSADYTGVTTTATIVVAQATPTVTWANPASILYGTALSSAQLDATASVPGTFTYSPAAGTVLGVGNNQTLSVTFTPTDTVDYTGASATAIISVLPVTSATFLNQDTTTQGTWIGTYGAQGYDVIDSSSRLPSYATITPSGQSNYVWTASTTDVRALQTLGGSTRIAATWFSVTSFSVAVNLTDGQVHDLEMYFLDWDKMGRSEQVQITSASTGTVLSTQSISSFQSGLYLNYAVSGSIVITFKDLGPGNAVLNGLFIDPSS
jgi:ELWxxDGT repeat protein